jgi:hypothetical protein
LTQFVLDELTKGRVMRVIKKRKKVKFGALAVVDTIHGDKNSRFAQHACEVGKSVRFDWLSVIE